MGNPEKLATLDTQNTGQINVRENRRDNPEKLATLGTQDTGQINVRENRKDNQEWTIQRNWIHKTQDEDKK